MHAHIHAGLSQTTPPLCCMLQVLIRPDILPAGQLADPSTWATPALELAPGFKAPMPSSFEALQQYIENSLPAESPVVYGMHPNAELSLLTSLGETLFKTITDVSGGSTGGGSGGASESAVRSALEEYMEKLPEPFIMLDIEARIKEKTPYVVVALQEVRSVVPRAGTDLYVKGMIQFPLNPACWCHLRRSRCSAGRCGCSCGFCISCFK
eukprot:GHRQ01031690.1.p1 GENE.GHRQ01031690.1~~GHRQ01031690.1.p1  ORF type:complete len:210 (+),score=58.01 GHRQ01031690.1:318-947(+)